MHSHSSLHSYHILPFQTTICFIFLTLSAIAHVAFSFLRNIWKSISHSIRDKPCFSYNFISNLIFFSILLCFDRLSYLSSSSAGAKRRSMDRPASSQGIGSYGSVSGGGHQCFLRPSSAQHHQQRRRRLSDNNFRSSATSQTSSLHTALSELAGDVEVVDMEDGALTGMHYSPHGEYHGQ